MKQHAQQQSGFTLVELLIATAIGLLLIAGIGTLFVSNKTIFNEVQQRGRLQEDMRFGMDRIMHDLRMGDFKGCQETYDDGSTEFKVEGYEGSGTNPDRLLLTHMQTTLSLSAMNISGTSLKVWSTGDLKTGESVEIQIPGDQYAYGPYSITAIAAGPDDNAPSGPDYYTITLDQDTGITGHKSSNGAAGLLLRGRASGVHDRKLYYIANNALYVKANAIDINDTTGSALVGDDQNDADRVENMQLLFGQDTDDDGSADTYVTADAITTSSGWGNVVSVKLAMLLATEAYGVDLDGDSHQLLNTTIPAANDTRKRRVAQTTVLIRNHLNQKGDLQ